MFTGLSPGVLVATPTSLATPTASPSRRISPGRGPWQMSVSVFLSQSVGERGIIFMVLKSFLISRHLQLVIARIMIA